MPPPSTGSFETHEQPRPSPWPNNILSRALNRFSISFNSNAAKNIFSAFFLAHANLNFSGLLLFFY